MKQLRILAVALALIGTLAAQAQVKFGVKGGIEVLDFKSDFFNADNRMGWFIGPTVKIGLPLPGFVAKLHIISDMAKAFRYKVARTQYVFYVLY